MPSSFLVSTGRTGTGGVFGGMTCAPSGRVVEGVKVGLFVVSGPLSVLVAVPPRLPGRRPPGAAPRAGGMPAYRRIGSRTWSGMNGGWGHTKGRDTGLALAGRARRGHLRLLTLLHGRLLCRLRRCLNLRTRRRIDWHRFDSLGGHHRLGRRQCHRGGLIIGDVRHVVVGHIFGDVGYIRHIR